MGVTLSEDLLRARSHVWDASVDVLRRTRRNAFAIRGAAPDMTIDVLSRFDRERVPSHRHRLIKSSSPWALRARLSGPSLPPPVRYRRRNRRARHGTRTFPRLKDLRALALHKQRLEEFVRQVDGIRGKYSRRSRLQLRIENAKLLEGLESK
jgi:hypothetical protein